MDSDLDGGSASARVEGIERQDVPVALHHRATVTRGERRTSANQRQRAFQTGRTGNGGFAAHKEAARRDSTRLHQVNSGGKRIVTAPCAVFTTFARTDGGGRTGFVDRLRQHRESPAGASDEPAARDRRANVDGCRTLARDSTVANRELYFGNARGGSRCRAGILGQQVAPSDGVRRSGDYSRRRGAGQQSTRLCCSRFARHASSVWNGSRLASRASRAQFFAQARTKHRRSEQPACQGSGRGTSRALPGSARRSRAISSHAGQLDKRRYGLRQAQRACVWNRTSFGRL